MSKHISASVCIDSSGWLPGGNALNTTAFVSENKEVTVMGFSVVDRSYLQVHQLELDSLGQQSRENKRNGRLVRAHVVKPVTPVSTVIQHQAGCCRLQSSVRMLI